jgi:hypothetical protein
MVRIISANAATKLSQDKKQVPFSCVGHSTQGVYCAARADIATRAEVWTRPDASPGIVIFCTDGQILPSRAGSTVGRYSAAHGRLRFRLLAIVGDAFAQCL